MIGRPINGQPTYCCIKEKGKNARFHGCNKVFARAHAVDAEVKARIVAVIDGPGLARRVKRLLGQHPDTALDAVTAQEERLRDIEHDYAAREIDKAEYLRLREDAKAILMRLRSQVKPLPMIEYGEGPLAAKWDELDIGQKRAILDTWLETVTIKPKGHGSGPKLDPARVVLTWKV